MQFWYFVLSPYKNNDKNYDLIKELDREYLND